MQMPVQCLECSHQTARRVQRDRVLACRGAFCDGLAGEYVCLATCGRLELYVAGEARPSEAWWEWLATRSGVPLSIVYQSWRLRSGQDAARHLLRVASGLASPILGEDQILGQVRTAFLGAQENGRVGPVLSALFRAAIHTGRRVRNETSLGAQVRTYAQRAVDVLLATPTVLGRVVVMGTGTVASELVDRMAELGVSPLAIVSRHRRRAVEMAARAGSRAVELDGLRAAIESADALVACTAASAPIIRTSVLANRTRPLHVIDLGAPRNVTPEAGALSHIKLVTLEDLLGGPAAVPEIVAVAEEVVDQELQRLGAWLRARHVRGSSAHDWTGAVA